MIIYKLLNFAFDLIRYIYKLIIAKTVVK